MKAIKIFFTAAALVAISFGAQAQGPQNTKFSTQTDHVEYRSTPDGESENRANSSTHNVSKCAEIPFYARFVSAFIRWQML